MAQKDNYSKSNSEDKTVQLVPVNHGKLNEAEIWQKFKEGDEEAFVWIYSNYFDVLYNFGRQFNLDASLVKDQIQDLFVDLRSSRTRLADLKSIKFYLFKSLRRRLFTSQKRQFSFLTLFSTRNETLFDIKISNSPEATLINRSLDQEKSEILTKSMMKLTPRQKEAIMHFYYEGMSYQEVAEIMDFKQVKSARKLIYRAIDALRNDLLGIKKRLLK